MNAPKPFNQAKGSLPIKIVFFGLGYLARHMVKALVSCNARRNAACFPLDIVGTHRRVVSSSDSLLSLCLGQGQGRDHTQGWAGVTLRQYPWICPGTGDQGTIDGSSLDAPGSRITGGRGDIEEIASFAAEADAWVVSIPPDEHGDGLLRCLEATREATSQSRLRGVAPGSTTFSLVSRLVPRHVMYFSATSVYGDHRGAWVTEESEVAPLSVQGQRRLLAEKQWQAAAARYGFDLCIARLAGIYGPGRSVVDKIARGEGPCLVGAAYENQPLLSRFYVDDGANLLATLLFGEVTGRWSEGSLSGSPGGRKCRIFNVADDCPATYDETLVYAYGLFGQSPPPLSGGTSTASKDSGKNQARNFERFFKDNKRVSGQSLRHATGLDLTYPSYREGLRYIYQTWYGL